MGGLGCDRAEAKPCSESERDEALKMLLVSWQNQLNITCDKVGCNTIR